MRNYATKGDIDSLRDEMRTYYASKADVSDVRVEVSDVRVEVSGVKVEVAGVRSDVSDLRADMAEMKSELIKWMVGLMFGAAAAATGLAVLIERIT